MTRFLTLLLVAGVFVSGYAAPQKDTRKKASESPITVNSVKVRLASAPVVKFDSLSNGRSIMNSRSHWAVMDVDFSVAKPGSGKQEKAYWFDGVVMEGELAMASQDERGEPFYVVYSGKTRFYCIARDDKRHEAMFAVPGQLLNRYYTYGRGFSVNMFIAGRVSFYDSSGRLLGEGYWQDGSMGRKDTSKVQSLLAKLGKGYSDVIQIRGGLFPKNRTPWKSYKLDRYELINDEHTTDGASVQNAKSDNDNI